MPTLNIADLYKIAGSTEGKYNNIVVGTINDHVVRLSIMTEPFYWHKHPDSDETFLVLEGILIIDLKDQSLELSEGQLFTVPKNVEHRTRPAGARSVNITFEAANMQTEKTN